MSEGWWLKKPCVLEPTSLSFVLSFLPLRPYYFTISAQKDKINEQKRPVQKKEKDSDYCWRYGLYLGYHLF